MRNSLDGAAPENAKQAFSGDFAATGETDFELIHYSDIGAAAPLDCRRFQGFCFLKPPHTGQD